MSRSRSGQVDVKPWTVRRAAPADADLVAELIDRSCGAGSHPYRAEIRDAIASGSATSFYCEWTGSAGEPVPFATASVIPNRARTRFELGWVAILPAYRGVRYEGTSPWKDLMARRLDHVDVAESLLTGNAATSHAKSQHVLAREGFVPVKFSPFEDPDMFGNGYREGGILFVRPGRHLDEPTGVRVPDRATDLVRRNLGLLSGSNRTVTTAPAYSSGRRRSVRLDVVASDDRGHASIRCSAVDGAAGGVVPISEAGTRIQALFDEEAYTVVELLIDANGAIATTLLDAIPRTRPKLTGFVPGYLSTPDGRVRDVVSYAHVQETEGGRLTAPMEVTLECQDLVRHTDFWKAGTVEVDDRVPADGSVQNVHLTVST